MQKLPAPTVRILSIGDELLLGKIADTNAAWLAGWCLTQGYEVVGSAQVGDGLAATTAALAAAIAAADVVLVSGGLGPTEDDRTRYAVAAVLNQPLAFDQRAWTDLITYWQTHIGPTVPETNRRQCERPAGARFIANHLGTAPGLFCRIRNSVVVCMPGVPREMRAMASALRVRLRRCFPHVVIPAVGEIALAGAGESTVQARIPGLLNERDPMVGITVQEAGHLVLRAVGKRIAVERTLCRARSALAEWVLPQSSVASSIIALASARRSRITTIESCTGGGVASALTAIPGASRVIGPAWVTYSDAAKRDLGVSAALLRTYGAVSGPVAMAMAAAGLLRGNAAIAVSVTGIAGSDGGTKSVRGGTKSAPVGTVWIGLARAGYQPTAEIFNFPGDRTEVRRRAVNAALLRLWQSLNGIHHARPGTRA